MKDWKKTGGKIALPRAGGDLGQGRFAFKGEVKFFNPKPKTKYTLLFVPYVLSNPKHILSGFDVGDHHFMYPMYVHRGYGQDGDVSYNCLRGAGEICPICKDIVEMYGSVKKLRTTDPEHPEVIAKHAFCKPHKATERVLFNVCNIEAPDDGVMLWDASAALAGEKFMREIQDSDDPASSNFFDPKNATSIILRFDEQVYNGRGFAKLDRVDISRNAFGPIPEILLDAAQPLDCIQKFVPYEELEQIYMRMKASKYRCQVSSDPEETVQNPCPTNRIFGKGFDGCPSEMACPEEVYNACCAAYDAMQGI